MDDESEGWQTFSVKKRGRLAYGPTRPLHKVQASHLPAAHVSLANVPTLEDALSDSDQVNRFLPLALPEPFHFEGLPAELRIGVYRCLAKDIDDIMYRETDPAVPEAWRGIPGPASRKKAVEMYCSILLVSKQFYHEFQGEYCADDWCFPVSETLTGPREYLDVNGREETILAKARSFEVMGRIRGKMEVEESPDYAVS